jgi:hypothetical protein
MEMRQAIEGLWKVDSMEQRYDDGRVIYPFGKHIQGYIFYGQDGLMFAAVQRADRAPFKTGKQWTASVEEKAAAYDSYLTYCGRYEVEDDRVTHAIEISLFPDWIGHRQIRNIKIEAGLLYITARLEDGTPEARTSYLQLTSANQMLT